MPEIKTLEQSAEYLKVAPKDLLSDIKAGRLRATLVAGQWRITTSALREFLGEPIGGANSISEAQMIICGTTKIKNLTFSWPKTKTEPAKLETYREVYIVELSNKVRNFSITFGQTERMWANQEMRSRIIVFLGKPLHLRPIVEFVETKDFSQSRRYASVIRHKGSLKHVRPSEPLPSGYDFLPTGIYDELVSGPRAAHSRAIVAAESDIETIARHAGLRALHKGLL